jgi:hypothetical protein
MEIWTIYCHTHINSGRRYIGMTVHTMLHRWNQHCAQAKNLKNEHRSHFAAAIRLYGKDAFSHIELAQSWDLEGANATEEALILQEGTCDPAKGFNLMRGGLHVPHLIRKNPWDRPEYRAKACAAAKERASTPAARAILAANGAKSRGRIHNAETQAKINAALTGRVLSLETKAKIGSHFKGKKHSPEHNAKMSALFRQIICKRGHLLRYYDGQGRNICRVCRTLTQKERRASPTSLVWQSAS